MLKLSANISLMFTEAPFLDRFSAAAQAGFQAVEIMYPYEFSALEMGQRLTEYGLIQSVINLPPGDYESGERGLAGLPGREFDYMASLELGLEYAQTLNCEYLHLLTGNLPPGATLADIRPLLLQNIEKAVRFFEPHGICVLLEPLSKYAISRYSLSTVNEALSIIKEIDSPNLKLQLDLYHTQLEEGNLSAKIEECFSYLRYVQVAGVPGRHEPDIGEINYEHIFSLLKEKAFTGWVGCEYVPLTDTVEGLGWITKYGLNAAAKRASIE